MLVLITHPSMMTLGYCSPTPRRIRTEKILSSLILIIQYFWMNKWNIWIQQILESNTLILLFLASWVLPEESQLNVITAWLRQRLHNRLSTDKQTWILPPNILRVMRRDVAETRSITYRFIRRLDCGGAAFIVEQNLWGKQVKLIVA